MKVAIFMVHILTPYSLDKNLGIAYNKAMSMIPEGDSACLIDYDVQFLTPDCGKILHEYSLINKGLMTCYTNRVHPTSPQLLNGLCENSDIKHHIKIAENQRKHLYEVEQLNKNISGMLMLISKDYWNNNKFNENLQFLGVDTDYSHRALPNVYLMKGLYVFHQYRMKNGINDKTHLL